MMLLLFLTFNAHALELQQTASQALYELYKGKSCKESAPVTECKDCELSNKKEKLEVLEALYFEKALQYQKDELKCEINSLKTVADSKTLKTAIVEDITSKIPALGFLYQEQESLKNKSKLQYADKKLEDEIKLNELLIAQTISSMWRSDHPEIQKILDRMTSAMVIESKKGSQARWSELTKQLANEVDVQKEKLFSKMLSYDESIQSQLEKKGASDSGVKKLIGQQKFIDRYVKEVDLSEEQGESLQCGIEAKYTVGPRMVEDTLMVGSFAFMGSGFLFKGVTKLASFNGKALQVASKTSQTSFVAGGALGLVGAAQNLAMECLEEKAHLTKMDSSCVGTTPENKIQHEIENGNCLLMVGLNAIPVGMAAAKIAKLRFFLGNKIVAGQYGLYRIADKKVTNASIMKLVDDTLQKLDEAPFTTTVLDRATTQRLHLPDGFAATSLKSDLYAEMIGRAKSLTMDETAIMHFGMLHHNPDFVRKFLANSKLFTDKEIYKIAEESVAFHRESPRTKVESFTKFYSTKRTWKDADSERLGELALLETKLEKAESKVVFVDPFYEKQMLYYFRRTAHEDLKKLYGEINPEILTLEAAGKLRISQTLTDDYKRVIDAFENLGTQKMRNFNKKFGHSDKTGSNIFSLRLNPMMDINPGSGKVVFDRDPNLRALLCRSQDGVVHVLKVYRKTSLFSEEGFKDVEKDYFEEARKIVKAKNLGCQPPIPN